MPLKWDGQLLVPLFRQLVAKFDKMRILFEMDGFGGWKVAALWDDIKFDWKYHNAIGKLIIVGDK